MIKKASNEVEDKFRPYSVERDGIGNLISSDSRPKLKESKLPNINETRWFLESLTLKLNSKAKIDL